MLGRTHFPPNLVKVGVNKKEIVSTEVQLNRIVKNALWTSVHKTDVLYLGMSVLDRLQIWIRLPIRTGRSLPDFANPIIHYMI